MQDDGKTWKNLIDMSGSKSFLVHTVETGQATFRKVILLFKQAVYQRRTCLVVDSLVLFGCLFGVFSLRVHQEYLVGFYLWLNVRALFSY